MMNVNIQLSETATDVTMQSLNIHKPISVFDGMSAFHPITFGIMRENAFNRRGKWDGCFFIVSSDANQQPHLRMLLNCNSLSLSR